MVREGFWFGLGWFGLFWWFGGLFCFLCEGRGRDTKTTVVCLCVLELLANTYGWDTWVGCFLFIYFVLNLFLIYLQCCCTHAG